MINGFIDGLTPIKRLTVSDWADEYRQLDSSASAEPGSWRTDRVPYLRRIMDDLSDISEVQEVIVMKGAQLGLTEAGNNWIGYTMHIAPAPMLMVMPTDETVKKNSNVRIDPMISATPILKERIGDKRSRDSQNTVKYKKFPGGFLMMAGANSPAGLRSLPVRKLFLDEVDAYPLDLDGEGSPLALARARTKTFVANRKIYVISTPTIEGASVIESEFLSTDQSYYHVPCPHCEHKQALEFERLKWEPGRPETARYICAQCEQPIEERHKPYMLANGTWVQHAPNNAHPLKRGYHINSLYSPYGWYSWEMAAREWDDAKGDESKEKTFINTVLGETWKVKGDVPEWQHIFNRREQYDFNIAPSSVLFVTVGVDVQKDRLELEIVGWCKGHESYSLDYRVLMGDTSSNEVWDKLAYVVGESWRREDGVVLPMQLMAVDSGYNTTHVYDFCKRFDVSRVIAVKGDNSDNQKTIISNPKPVDVMRNGKAFGQVKVWKVGVSLLKSELYGFLKLQIGEDGEVPRGYCHFPEYGVEFFKGLTGERLETKTVNGYIKHYWVKHYERNEPLDCRVYARAAASVVGIDRIPHENLEMAANKMNVVAPENNNNKRERKRRNGGSFW